MKPTYVLPPAYVTLAKRQLFRDLVDRYGLRNDAVSDLRKRGRIGAESYDKLRVFLADHGLTPLDWEDVVATSSVDFQQEDGQAAFQAIRRQYQAGRTDLALTIAATGMSSRNSGAWFHGAWGMMSVANRSGQDVRFLDAARFLLRRLDRPVVLPPDNVRAMMCDVAKWLIEHGAIRQGGAAYDPLMDYFGRRIERVPSPIASSLLRAHGTLQLLRGRFARAAAAYRSASDLGYDRLEAVTGNWFWRAEEHRLNALTSRNEDAWDRLEKVVGDCLNGRRRGEVSPETLLSARLQLALRPEWGHSPRMLQDYLDDVAQWTVGHYRDLAGFIVPGTGLAALPLQSRRPQTRDVLRRLLRPPLSESDIRTATALIQSLARHASIPDDLRAGPVLPDAG